MRARFPARAGDHRVGAINAKRSPLRHLYVGGHASLPSSAQLVNARAIWIVFAPPLKVAAKSFSQRCSRDKAPSKFNETSSPHPVGLLSRQSV